MAAMAAGDEHAAAEVLRGLARHLNCLNEDNKTTRKRALEQIKRETVDKGLSSSVLQEVFSALLKPLLKCLSDPMERCRETAISVITEFIRGVPKPEESLPYLLPCLAQRLGEKEILEPAEELRLSAVEMLTLTVEVCGKHLAPYLNEVMNTLQRTIVDPFPDVKRESCKCTVKFATCVPEHFHMQAESLVKPLMQTIAHQHSRVRVSVIEATGAVIQHGTGKNVDDVLSHLAQRLFDDSPQVRKAVTAVVGDWLLHMRDRYSYFHKLVPLLLSSINDEIPEIRLLAADLWRQVGAQWEKENEDDIKDKMDFLLTPPPFYPPGVARPGLGCRELVMRNLGRLVPAITHDITDWLVPTRVRTSQLLSVLLLHAEDHSTQHMQPLLATLYQACTDAEREVVSNCLAAAKLLGTFVPPAVFLKLLLDHVTNPYSSSHPWAPLMVLAAMLAGCSKPLLKPHLEQIANTLAQPDVCQEYQQVMYLEQLLACVDVLLCQCESDCGSVSLQLLQVLVTVQSLSTETNISEKAFVSVQCLCKVQGLDSVMQLYRQHMGQLLDWLSATVNTWSSYSPQRLQLHIIVIQSGPVIGEFVSQLMILLRSCLQPDKDPEMRLSTFTMLAKLLLDAANTLDSHGHFHEESERFLCDVLLPNLVWRAGRIAGAVRTSALSCLLALLHGGAITPGKLLCLEEKLSPQVLSALEEDSQMGRLLACRSVSTILRLIGTSLHPEALNKIYPELLKRLDDSSEEVRSVALQALGLWLSSLAKDYNPELFAAHLQLLFQQLLLHLDDPNASVQEQVLEILKKGSSVHPVLLKREVETVRDKQRSPLHCDQLLQHISSLPTETTADCPSRLPVKLPILGHRCEICSLTHKHVVSTALLTAELPPGHFSLSLPLSPSFLSRTTPLPSSCAAVPSLPSTMLQTGDEVMYFSAVFLLVVLATRSATGASLLTAFLYVFMVMFRFPPVPTDQAGRVLRPRAPPGGVPVVAHRAGSHDAPENTLAAIREASRNGATGVELDLSFTADGVPVLMHDETVDRTTNGSGPISKLQVIQLRRLDAAAHHRLKDKFSGEKVPTLQEAVEECIRHQLTIFFDVKGQPDKAASVLREIYRKFPVLYNASVVSSFEPKVIYKMRQTDHNVVTALIHRPWRLSRFSDGTPRTLSTWGQLWTGVLDILLDWAHHHILWKLCGVSAILVHKDFISLDYVQYWAERGVEVVGWTVNTAVEKDYYQNLLKIGYITDSLLEDCDPHY